MGYPETFEGFMINEIGKYQDFKKQSVSLSSVEKSNLLTLSSSSHKDSETTTLTSRSSAVVSAAVMSTRSLEDGVLLLLPLLSVTK